MWIIQKSKRNGMFVQEVSLQRAKNKADAGQNNKIASRKAQCRWYVTMSGTGALTWVLLGKRANLTYKKFWRD